MEILTPGKSNICFRRPPNLNDSSGIVIRSVHVFPAPLGPAMIQNSGSGTRGEAYDWLKAARFAR